jgi:hypothetical protein
MRTKTATLETIRRRVVRMARAAGAPTIPEARRQQRESDADMKRDGERAADEARKLGLV